jgi:hypothetical protein
MLYSIIYCIVPHVKQQFVINYIKYHILLA